MEIKTIKVVTDEKGRTVKPDVMYFCSQSDNSAFTAIYKRINEKNNLVFENPLTHEEFAKRPASVTSAQPVNIEFAEED